VCVISDVKERGLCELFTLDFLALIVWLASNLKIVKDNVFFCQFCFFITSKSLQNFCII